MKAKRLIAILAAAMMATLAVGCGGQNVAADGKGSKEE